ncbi:hypothetical protein MRX96_019592 [Rhipicephalus microplus]
MILIPENPRDDCTLQGQGQPLGRELRHKQCGASIKAIGARTDTARPSKGCRERPRSAAASVMAQKRQGETMAPHPSGRDNFLLSLTTRR